MFTLAVFLFGIKLVNWHGDIPDVTFNTSETISYSPSFFPVTIELTLGAAPPVTPAADSKEVKGKIVAHSVPAPAHPDVVAASD